MRIQYRPILTNYILINLYIVEFYENHKTGVNQRKIKCDGQVIYYLVTVIYGG